MPQALAAASPAVEDEYARALTAYRQCVRVLIEECLQGGLFKAGLDSELLF